MSVNLNSQESKFDPSGQGTPTCFWCARKSYLISMNPQHAKHLEIEGFLAHSLLDSLSSAVFIEFTLCFSDTDNSGDVVFSIA